MIQGSRILLDAAMVALGLCAMALLGVYRLRKLRIAQFARNATHDSRSQHDAAFQLGRLMFGEIKRRHHDPPFLMPLLAPLGPSPVTVLKEGGCCSGVNRLFITCLDTMGIRAGQITVYRRADPAHAHCLAQVAVDTAILLIDVDYGVWLCRPDGAPLDLAGLRSGVTPTIEPFVLDREAPYANSPRTRPAGYPDREYYRFDYILTRNANWAETRPRRVFYAVLRPLTRGRVDCVLVPPIFEWPEVLLAAVLCGVIGVLFALRTLSAGM